MLKPGTHLSPHIALITRNYHRLNWLVPMLRGEGYTLNIHAFQDDQLRLQTYPHPTALALPLQGYSVVWFHERPWAKDFMTTLYERLDRLPIRVINRRLSSRKSVQYTELEKGKVPYPPFVLENQYVEGKFGYPLIVKWEADYQGRRCHIVFTPQELKNLLPRLNRIGVGGNVIPYLMQKYIDCGGVRTKAFVVGSQVVGAFAESSRNGYITGSHGTTEKIWKVDDYQKYHSIATQAVKAVGIDMASVDIVEDKQGKQWVLEVNNSFYPCSTHQHAMELVPKLDSAIIKELAR